MALLGVAVLSMGLAPVSAERLRISPEDLRLRVAVSEELTPAVRREITELANSVPLPVTEGVLQTEQLFQDKFGARGWTERRLTLSRYYFLVARLEQSQKFSDEFARREEQLRLGRELLGQYIDKLNPMVARASYPKVDPLVLETVQGFPLSDVGSDDEGNLRVLHLFPEPQMSMGRENLRMLRDTAESERSLLGERLSQLHEAENAFLAEVHLVGEELLATRDPVKRWVKKSRAGLPFSL